MTDEQKLAGEVEEPVEEPVEKRPEEEIEGQTLSANEEALPPAAISTAEVPAEPVPEVPAEDSVEESPEPVSPFPPKPDDSPDAKLFSVTFHGGDVVYKWAGDSSEALRQALAGRGWEKNVPKVELVPEE